MACSQNCIDFLLQMYIKTAGKWLRQDYEQCYVNHTDVSAVVPVSYVHSIDVYVAQVL